MAFYSNLQTTLARIDERSWYTYAAIGLGIFIALLGAIIFFYYRAANRWQEHIESINQEREDVRKLITKSVQIQKQREHMNALLQEDPNFKIKEFMQDALAKFGIAPNDVASQTDASIDRDDNFKEHRATYQIVGINMRQLTELLQEIDENPRVFTKELDITKAKKVPHAIDISITIAAMIPK